jgi:2-oxoglutarate dehydrogenase E2 component (dihydrolipoamide succinyltransferase)
LQAADVKGTGRDGRITPEDVHGRQRPGAGRALALAAMPEADRIVPLNKVRRMTAARMVHSVATSPHTLQAVEVDFLRVEHARATHGAGFRAGHAASLNYLPFICRAVCEAIAEFPYINASFIEDALLVHPHVHLAIAVDLAHDGLLAPVLSKAEQHGVGELAVRLTELVARARRNALPADELTGGTYTISNSGSFGTLITAPIINQPQVAILSTDGVRKKPIVLEGPQGDVIAIRPVGILAQSFDHRAFDGAYSAAFLRRVKQILEERDWTAQFAEVTPSPAKS